jgi:hypothetical protein
MLLLHFRTATAVTNALHPVSGPWLRNYSDELALETLFLFMLQRTGVVFLLCYTSRLFGLVRIILLLELTAEPHASATTAWFYPIYSHKLFMRLPHT